MLSFIIEYIEHFTYLGIFIVITSGSIGVPVPEEIPLIIGGFMFYKGYVNIYLLIGIAIFAIITSDLIIFYIGRNWGRWVVNHRRLSKIFSIKRLKNGEKYFKKYGRKAVFIGRFLSGIRVISLLSAGIFKMNIWEFLALDFMSAIISVPLFVGIGYISAQYIEVFLKFFYKFDKIVGFLSILILMSLFIYMYIRGGKIKLFGEKKD
jgi:membrane protein DedA with SNARE-associated domain